MNDLNYTEWMKFQKSFFRFSSNDQLVKECIQFFTKSVWEDGIPSNSLLVGFDSNDHIFPRPRIISSTELTSLFQLESTLAERINQNEKYDFIIINLLGLVGSENDFEKYLRDSGPSIFSKIRSLMQNDRYGVFLIDYSNDNVSSLPYPWTLSYALRSHLKLRDEKIGIIENKGQVFYCVFFQSSDDNNDLNSYTFPHIQTSDEKKTIPLYIIPKPPPRSKQEIRHPGKFPETLVAQFIELFTKPGDLVFDPMAGAGSTLIAACEIGRNAYGIELNEEFVEVARKRIERVNPAITLFREEKRLTTEIILGDCRNLNSFKDLSQFKVDYCITSPPYWSMLTNRGSEYQRSRKLKNLPQTYSTDNRDIANIANYFDFLETLEKVYRDVANLMKQGSYLTIVVKNIKREHKVYPIAFDIVRLLCNKSGPFEFAGNTFWLQDDVGMKPFAVGIHWVSNVVHQYCIHLRRKIFT